MRPNTSKQQNNNTNTQEVNHTNKNKNIFATEAVEKYFQKKIHDKKYLNPQSENYNILILQNISYNYAQKHSSWGFLNSKLYIIYIMRLLYITSPADFWAFCPTNIKLLLFMPHQQPQTHNFLVIFP